MIPLRGGFAHDPIIDADGQVVEPRALWEDYAEPQFRDRMIQVRRNRDGGDELFIDGENRSRPSLPVAASMTPGGLSDLERARKFTWDDILPGGYDPHARIKVMDEEGIDVAVLYPSLWLLYGDLTDPPLAAAACRAYNNWLADFCKALAKRLYGVAPMPIQNVDEAVREMRRVVRELGFKAVFVRPNPFNGRRLNDAFLCSVLARGAGARHSGGGSRQFRHAMPTMGGDSYYDPLFFHMVCHPFEQQAACMDIVMRRRARRDFRS